eukprot:m.233985 g.233985  ORF g.233985 m.233985 type:complete len:58 (+) comp15745_c0_seq4:3650-3823(+)
MSGLHVADYIKSRKSNCFVDDFTDLVTKRCPTPTCPTAGPQQSHCRRHPSHHQQLDN